MMSATIKVRGIPDSTLDMILELLREEAKDVRVESWSTNEIPGYIPRGSYPERAVTRGGRRA